MTDTVVVREANTNVVVVQKTNTAVVAAPGPAGPPADLSAITAGLAAETGARAAADAALSTNVAAAQAAAISACYRAPVIYSSGWPARPAGAAAGTVRYISTSSSAPTPSDMQEGDVYEVAIDAPVNISAPIVSGVMVAVGIPLTTTTGSWANATGYIYQWNKNGTPIAAATTSTYTPVSGDVAGTLTVTVTANGPGGSAAATSSATVAVANLLTPDTLTLSKWTGSFANATLFISSGTPHSGSNTLNMTSSANGNYGVNATSTGRLTVTAGQVYAVQMFTRAVSSNRKCAVLAQFYDAGGALVGSSINGGFTNLVAGGWVTLAGRFTAPSTAAKIEIGLTILSQDGTTITAGDSTYTSAI